MISCELLEREGKWRNIGVVLLLLMVVLPPILLLWSAVASVDSDTPFVSGTYTGALLNSALVALTTVVICFTVGLPMGTLAALYQIPGKKFLMAFSALPLLVPSFLWAIGWSRLLASWSRSASQTFSGFPGCVIVFCAWGIPLVLLTAFAVVIRLSASQVEAARLAGGERVVFREALRYAVQPGLLAASLSGVLTLTDPGPGLIFGLRTAASEILTSFAALFDFGLAGRQCVLLAGVVSAVAAPLAYFAAPRLATEVMPRQVRTQIEFRHLGLRLTAIAGLVSVIGFGTLLPLAGLSLPLFGTGMEFERAAAEIVRTWRNTLTYALGAGLTAALMGFLLGFTVGRRVRLRMLCLGICVGLFSLPPTLAVLGIIQLSAEAPAWTDPLLRSRATICLVQGFRFFPVAAFLGLQAWAAMSSTWTWVGAIHGVSLMKYLWRVVLPFMSPGLGLSVLLVGLLATADVGTVLLLQPPGETSFPLAIFTIMANAPESLVASLCLLYVLVAGGLLTLIMMIAGRVKV